VTTPGPIASFGTTAPARLGFAHPRYAQSRDLPRQSLKPRTPGIRPAALRHECADPAHAVVEPAPGGPSPAARSGVSSIALAPLRAQFDDRELTGFAGDTLASALLAAGDPLVAQL
jgi:hypothetical protein